MHQLTIEDIYARKCDKCNKGFNAGYLDSGSYFCSANCLISTNKEDDPNYTIQNWYHNCEEYEDECYYSEWYDDLEETFLNDTFDTCDIFKEDGKLITESEFNEIKKGLLT